MTTVHDEFLELAAAAIDFELSRDERATLERHLADCSACRHRVAGFAADQTAIARLPRYVLGPAAATAVRGRITRRTSTARPTDAPAGRGRHARRCSRWRPLRSAHRSIGATRSGPDRGVADDRTQPRHAGPGSGRPRGRFAAVEMSSPPGSACAPRRPSTTRSRPSSNRCSIEACKLEMLDGPVTADDYDWYLVQAIGWPHRGWVAAADHDGVAWIEDPAARPRPHRRATADEAALVVGASDRRRRSRCAPRRDRAARAGRRGRRLPGRIGAGRTRRGIPISGRARRRDDLSRPARLVQRRTDHRRLRRRGRAAMRRGCPVTGRPGRTDRVHRRDRSVGRRPQRLLSRRERHRQRPGDLRVDVRRDPRSRDADLADLDRWRWPPRPARSRPAGRPRDLPAGDLIEPVDAARRLSASSQRILTRSAASILDRSPSRGTRPMDTRP